MGSAAGHWSLDDLDWSALEPDAVSPGLLEVVKTAALVEANSADYVTYLHRVFADDADFRAAASVWGAEEAQHGAALGAWAQRVDPGFDFAGALERFRAGYSLPLGAAGSVRGSPAGELLARCVVESGTCSFYAALRDHTREPVLRRLCHFIAQDESRHYRLFETHYRRYQVAHPLSWWQRLRIALGRVLETDDDELAFAFYSANGACGEGAAYDRRRCARRYQALATGVYRESHVRTVVHMIAAALGFDPAAPLVRGAGRAGWWYLRRRAAGRGALDAR